MIDKFEMYTHLYICIDIHVYIVIDTYISIYNWCIIQGMVFNGSTSYHSNTCDKLECPTIYWYKRTIWFVMKHEIKMKPHKYHSISIYLKQLEKGLYDRIAAASLTSQWTSCSRWCSIFFWSDWEEKNIFIHLISMISIPMHCFLNWHGFHLSKCDLDCVFQFVHL